MRQLVHAEWFKLRTTSTGPLFALAVALSSIAVLVVNCVNAHSLLKPFDQYVLLQAHGNSAADLPAGFVDHLRSDWTLGHSPITQAAAIYTSGQLLGVLLSCLLGIVLVTSEYQQHTATTTYLVTPRRTRVVGAKLVTAVLVASGFWLASTLLDLVAGAVFLHGQGFGTQLGHPGVPRAMALSLAAYAVWAVFGVGLGALIRSQLGATIFATVLYLIGGGVAGSVFDLLNTYVIKHDWILTAQVIIPSTASTIMTSPTKTFDQSPAQWVGAVVLVAYGVLTALAGTAVLRRRDIA